MKQGKIYNKIILALVLAAVVLYMAYAVVSAVREPLTTTRAIEFEAGEGCSVDGWIVRDEQVLTSPFGITVLERSEGEKVGTGQVVATGYDSADAQARQAEIDEITAQLEQLSYASAYDLNAADTAALDRELTAQLLSFARHVARGDLDTAASQSTEIKGLVLRRNTDQDDLTSIQAQSQALQTQLAQLQSAPMGDTAQIVAPTSGYFSGQVDGYESVLTPALLETVSLRQLESLTPAQVPSGACGRLISDADWYFAASVPSSYAADTLVGDTVTVTFSQSGVELTMTVQRVGDEENGSRLLVLRSSDYIQDVTQLREVTADVVFRSYTGLRVPKEAMRSQNGQDGVYVLESATARWKPVEILYDNGESYIVALDKTSTDNLWPGDEIIIRAKNLYDGKVVIES